MIDICALERAYRGTKLLGGASRGRMVFLPGQAFDPYDRLLPAQHTHGKVEALAPAHWPRWQEMAANTLRLAGVEATDNNGALHLVADGKVFGLAGYASH